MEAVILGYFLCLLGFAFNGILLMGVRQKQAELIASEERIVRLLMRAKLRRVK